nr:MAG TPA: hypothetical protein [Caudoviricetes sp.]
MPVDEKPPAMPGDIYCAQILHITLMNDIIKLLYKTNKR